MRKYNYITDSYEDDGQPDFMSGIPQMPEQQSVVPQQQADMDPVVKEYLMNKMNPAPVDEDIALPELKQSSPGLLDSYSPEKYNEALSQMKERQSNTALAQLAAGIGDALARKDSSSSDRYFQDVRSNIQDQTVGEFNRKKASVLTDVKSKQQLNQLDPESQESQNFKKTVEATMPNIVKAYGKNWKFVTAADRDSILEFGKMRETIDVRKAESQLKYEATKGTRADRAMKAQDLSSTRAKQMGLYKNGVAAEQQFLDATNDSSDYDPTGSGQLIDNSDWAPNLLKNNKAIESQAARDAWVESFLRDASGAAISEKERGSYNKLYFPQPGDTADVVSNKKALRDEKMRSAAAGAGLNHDKADIPKKEIKGNKPKSIKQNGVTYTLNESTGEYE